MKEQKAKSTKSHKVVSLLSLSSFNISNYLQSTSITTMKSHPKSNTVFQVINTQLLTKQETLFAIRASDILFIILCENFDYKDYEEITKFMPHFIICYINRNEIKSVKKFAKDKFALDKIVYIDQLWEQLDLKDRATSIVDNNPCHFVPERINYNGCFVEMTGILKNGLKSKRMVVNGIDYVDIVSLEIDGVSYDGNYVDENEKIMEELNKRYKCDEIIEEESKDKNEIVKNLHNDDFENINDGSEASSDEDYKENTERRNEAITNESSEDIEGSVMLQYKDYKGINNLSTCEFITEEYPEHYSNLHFFENIIEIQKTIKKLPSKIPNSTKVKIIAKSEAPLNYNHIVCFNVFEIENIHTIYNLDFNTSLNILKNESISIDFGHKIINVNPLISNSSKHKVHVSVEEGNKGCISFIAPITLNFNKALIYKNGINIGYCTNNSFYDRIMLDEIKLKGNPRKVDKRYCTVSDMFNSKADVLYYRNLPVYTKCGNQGIIKKPIGTHGIFKSFFSRPVNHGSKIYLSLYKREFLKEYNQ